ncbi:beta-1,4 N-acetylgalactosaminyltransferase 1-like [Saccoglossus kowalevskii]|uniref:Beta-1,4 N-acetylgalactosaminyltransferase 1-like n=1 Tax=Saccoglossus kowalevskii TaxID=10224 RepID=A0ABM0LWG0_SACKO|nr:PREDICTED: beta-1,4 N-acetylgalactosaminyltransferase 1-like [Saccoglossus kowalevskii]
MTVTYNKANSVGIRGQTSTGDIRSISAYLENTTKHTANDDRDDAIDNRMRSVKRRCSCSTLYDKLPTETRATMRIESRASDNRQLKRGEPIIVCAAMSPVNYIGSGLLVEPLKSIPVIGLFISDYTHMPARFNVSIISLGYLGTVSLPCVGVDSASITGNNSEHLEVALYGHIIELNRLLSSIVYTSTVYDIDTRDTIEIRFLNFDPVHISVHIKRSLIPERFDLISNGDLSQQVTIIVKTFERYEGVLRLIDSVHKFYPNMTIIVADDNRKMKHINRENVKQYGMPFKLGNFPGRNVILSQVRTKYVVYVDDDMFFTNKTKLELMVDKLENRSYHSDLVSGSLTGYRNNTGQAHLMTIDYSDHGMCYRGIERSIPHPSFPNCQWTELSLNFFMAKTSTLRKIWFDNRVPFNRGHIEFWLDALGRTQSIFCKDVWIHHDSQTVNSKSYDNYRWKHGLYTKHIMFQNNLCELNLKLKKRTTVKQQ